MQKLANLLKWNAEQFNKDWNLQYDNVVRKVFTKNPSNTDVESVLIKVAVLNSLYRTNIFDFDKMKEHIVMLGKKKELETLLKSGDLEAVTLIRHDHGIRYNNNKGIDMDAYSFSTKYCHWSNPNSYPMMDQYVIKAIMRLKRDFFLSGFKRMELRDVNIFKIVIDNIREIAGIQTYKEIDQALWMYGQSL